MALLRDVVIVGVARTPLGSFGSNLASLKAPELGAAAIRAAVERAGIRPEDVGEVYMGNVCQAGIGQAPARQAVLKAGLPTSTACTTINKVCASGMKAVMLASQSIMLGHQDCIVAGGFESMSNIPHLLPAVRNGIRMGNGTVVDSMVHDGLWDPYDNQHMGNIAELCARKHGITREMQDEFSLASYQRAKKAHEAGYFKDEIVPISIPQRRGDPIVISDDEDYHKLDEKKFRSLAPAFDKNGTVTAGNSSKLTDGGCALVIMAEEVAKQKGLKPLARIKGFGDAELAPVDFPIAPASASRVALKRAGLSLEEISFFETNEAFGVVTLANMKLLNIPHEKMNVHGGAVALGHPIGCSGARIIATLTSVLRIHGGKYGLASICNGGGGASAIVIENVGN